VRFKTFIVLAIAIAIGLGGYSFARVEHSIHQQGIELVQERLNACKFKLYDLAVGSEAHKVHSQKGSPQYNPRQAEVLAGALRVVLTIPSAKECIPVITEAIKREGPNLLTPKVERALMKLAVESSDGTTLTSPPSSKTKQAPGLTHRPRTTTTPKRTTSTPMVPPITVTTPAPARPDIPAPKATTPTTSTPKSTPPVKTPTATTPTTKTPPVTVPPITTPPIEVPPIITTPSIEVPPITVPPIEVPPIKINLEEPLCKVPVVKLLTCPKP
jgi:hypothetical protein